MLRMNKMHEIAEEVAVQMNAQGEVSFAKAYEILEDIRIEEKIGLEEFMKLTTFTMRELGKMGF